MKLFNNEYRNDGLQYFCKDDSRKPRLTLKHLNQLRKTKEIRQFERAYAEEQLEKIYGNSSESQ